jgi:DNA polymerase III gamma/tau subunit
LIAATADQRPALEKAAAQFSEEDLTRFFQILLQTDDDLRRKSDPRVHLEMGLLRLINAARLAPLEELLSELKSGAPSSGTNSGMARGAAQSASRVPAPARFASSPGAATGLGTPAFAPTAKASPASFAAAAPALAISSPLAAPAAAKNEAVEETCGDSAKSNGAAMQVSGIAMEQVAEIKSAIQAQQKFLGELVEQSSRWELEGAELRIYFSPEKRPFAEMIEGRETLEKIRSISSKVLGRTVRVCAKLEAVAAATASASRSGAGTQELRAQFERDPMVQSMLQRFGGKISEVKRRQEGS